MSIFNEIRTSSELTCMSIVEQLARYSLCRLHSERDDLIKAGNRQHLVNVVDEAIALKAKRIGGEA